MSDMSVVMASELVAGDRARIGYATYYIERVRTASRKLGGIELILLPVRDNIIERQDATARVVTSPSKILCVLRPRTTAPEDVSP